MQSVRYNKKDWAVYTVREADKRGIQYVPWRELFDLKNKDIIWVLGDTQHVHPVIHLYRRTMLVTPYRTLSRTAKNKKLICEYDRTEKGRLGGRGYDPPEEKMTLKHQQFCWAFVYNNFDGTAAFRTIWRGKRYRKKAAVLAKELLDNHLIMEYLMKMVEDTMNARGLTDEFLLDSLKKLIEEGSGGIKLQALQYAIKLKGTDLEPGHKKLPTPQVDDTLTRVTQEAELADHKEITDGNERTTAGVDAQEDAQ